MTQDGQPTLPERARELLLSERAGALATQSLRHRGWPFVSAMPYAIDVDGAPIFLISGMAVHTKNLRSDPHASLLVVQGGVLPDALTQPRATLIGMVEPIDSTPTIAKAYVEAHPAAKQWIGFADFSFFRMEVTDAYFVAGFGTMGWITRADFVRVMRPGG